MKKLVKKAWLVFDAEEIEPNNDINLYRGESWLLRGLIFRLGPLWFPFGLVAPRSSLAPTASQARAPG